jgi:flagellar biosynthesis protein FliQ
MTETEILDIAREALLISIKIGAPVMLIGLVVGVSIALLQALTQIQEMTLVFVPKILAMFIAMFVFLPWMMMTLVDFMQDLADRMIGAG